MPEEFHGNGLSGADWKGKLLYGWGTLNANIWLPSLSELVGITGTQDASKGTCFSAMQGLNVSVGGAWPYIDVQGGSQWAYPAKYNAAGGGTLLWTLGGKEEFWIRTPDCGQNHAVLSFQSENGVRYVSVVTTSRAVHPAVRQVQYRSEWFS